MVSGIINSFFLGPCGSVNYNVGVWVIVSAASEAQGFQEAVITREARKSSIDCLWSHYEYTQLGAVDVC